jgi:hypothetical protein
MDGEVPCEIRQNVPDAADEAAVTGDGSVEVENRCSSFRSRSREYQFQQGKFPP